MFQQFDGAISAPTTKDAVRWFFVFHATPFMLRTGRRPNQAVERPEAVYFASKWTSLSSGQVVHTASAHQEVTLWLTEHQCVLRESYQGFHPIVFPNAAAEQAFCTQFNISPPSARGRYQIKKAA
jgi:hypothetical protein